MLWSLETFSIFVGICDAMVTRDVFNLCGFLCCYGHWRCFQSLWVFVMLWSLESFSIFVGICDVMVTGDVLILCGYL